MGKRIASSIGRKAQSNALANRAGARRCAYLVAMEPLEGRTLYSTVTNTLDSGPGSLRQAILDANAAVSPQTISFAIPSTGPGDVQRISIQSPLPSLTNAITIDGTTQSGYVSSPVILIDGSDAAKHGSPLAYGLTLAGAGQVVRGLALAGFANAQLLLTGPGGDVVTASTFGLGTDPTAVGVQNANGIVVDSPNNTIGGTSAADRNVIAGNGWDGILVHAGGNLIAGNYIGMGADGTTAVGNNNVGIEVDGAAGVFIVGNVISANNGDGISLHNVTAAPSRIAGNVIGLDAAGSNWIRNSANGILLLDSSNVTIGGATAADRNVISGNDADGVRLIGSSSNTILGNYIGLDATGSQASDADDDWLGNSGNGITILVDYADLAHPVDSTNNVIGGAAGNVIAGSGGDGIRVETLDNSTQILGNFIGTDATGLRATDDANGETFGNDGDGIAVIDTGAVIVGNVVSNNRQTGIFLNGDNSVVRGNLIGVAADGVTPLPTRLGAGVLVWGSGNVIGGDGAGQGNVIRFNHTQGVAVSFGTGNAIRGNSIDSNDGIGIDLGGNGVTPNGSLGHVGANNFQNFPQLDSATGSTAGVLDFTGHLTAAPGTYTLDFYTSPLADPSGFGQGKTFVGSAVVTVGPSGTAAFTVTFIRALAGDQVVSATATDASGNTSEFSATLAITQVAPPAPDQTSTQLASSSNPSTVGQPVTFTATVADVQRPGTTPTGVVQFRDGTTVLGSGPLDASGRVSITLTNLAAGPHSITAFYLGDSDFDPSASAPLAQTVNLAPTTTTLTTSVTPSVFGQSVTFTATVHAPTAIVPGGTVVFMDGNTVLGTATLAGGVATLTTSALSAGTHAITAVYAGDATFNGSASDPLTQTVTAPLGTITGRTLTDLSGNGLTADDTPFAGVTVNLYRDLNGDGALDPSDGGPVATTLSDAAGVYAFAGLPLGQYLVRELAPGGSVRTAPALSDVYDVTLSGAATLSGFDFDNFIKCPTVLTKVSFKITRGHRSLVVSDLRGKTLPGDTVTATFTVGAAGGRVTLVTYDAPGATFDANTAYLQSIHEVSSEAFTPGMHTLTVHIPDNDYQIDLVTCQAIDHFGPAGSNIFYSPQNRLISADNGGPTAAPTSVGRHNPSQSPSNPFDSFPGRRSARTDLATWLASSFRGV